MNISVISSKVYLLTVAHEAHPQTVLYVRHVN